MCVYVYLRVTDINYAKVYAKAESKKKTKIFPLISAKHFAKRRTFSLSKNTHILQQVPKRKLTYMYINMYNS